MRYLLPLILLFIFASSCKKTFDQPPSNYRNFIQLFSVPEDYPKQFQAISRFLLNKETKQSFLQSFSERCGEPVWEQSVLMPAPSIVANSNTPTSNTSEDVVLVPLVKDSLVRSFMACIVSGDSVRIKVYKDNRYGLRGYGQHSQTMSAEYLSLQFMLLNKRVFGFENFKITDTLLFSNIPELAPTRYIKLKEPQSPTIASESNSFSISYQVCTSVEHEGDQGNLVGTAPGEANDYHYVETVCFIRIIWIDDNSGGGSGSGGTGGPSGGGSGGGGGDPTNPGGGGGGDFEEDDCDPNAPTTIKGDPCSQEGPGWEPVPDPLPSVTNSQAVSALKQMIGLNRLQTQWAENHPEQTQFFLDFLVDNEVSEFSTAAVKTAMDVQIAGNLNTAFDLAHYNTFKSYSPLTASIQTMDPLTRLIAVHAAFLRWENPDWPDWKIYTIAVYEASIESIHVVLDIGGLVPVIGEVADITNGVIYTLQGDGVNAALSYASAVPFAGWAATAAKFAKRTITAADGTSRTLKWYKGVTGLIGFGDRHLLRKVLGLPVGDPRQAHHIIPWDMANDEIVQIAAKKNFHLNDLSNGIPVSLVQHADGGHANYIARVRQLAQVEVAQRGGYANISPDEAASILNVIIAKAKAAIVQHPNAKLNDLIF